MSDKKTSSFTRRKFLASSAAAVTAPTLVSCVRSDRGASESGGNEHPAVTDAPPPPPEPENPVANKDHEYEIIHDWAQLPAEFSWQTTHNVAVDREGLVYVIHQGDASMPDHPSIFVFDKDGKYVRSFGNQFQGGGHGLDIREENGEEFMYVTGYKQLKTFAKLDMLGETVWQKYAPMESGLYAEGEDTNPQNEWGRDRFLPTNFAFLPDGSFYLADGYGSYYIHLYDKDANWQSCFGGPGEGEGKFNTSHGLWVDDRSGREPTLVVTDRAHNTVQILTLDGEYIETLEGYGLPANIDTWNDLMVVPELVARVTLLDGNNNVVAHIGDDTARIGAEEKHLIRSDPSAWQSGKFVHPHDACFDADGNIFVAEWVATGRVSKLKRLS